MSIEQLIDQDVEQELNKLYNAATILKNLDLIPYTILYRLVADTKIPFDLVDLFTVEDVIQRHEKELNIWLKDKYRPSVKTAQTFKFYAAVKKVQETQIADRKLAEAADALAKEQRQKDQDIFKGIIGKGTILCGSAGTTTKVQ